MVFKLSLYNYYFNLIYVSMDKANKSRCILYCRYVTVDVNQGECNNFNNHTGYCILQLLHSCKYSAS